MWDCFLISMCGILGYFHHDNASELVKKGLSLLSFRGRDACGVASENDVVQGKDENDLVIAKNNSCIAHALHALVGHVPQPIKGKGILSFNGEIYNWKKLAKEYKIEAENDAQVLLYLLDGMNSYDAIDSVLDKLDGVYAFCYWHNDTVILARDILGVKPLWYSHQNGFSFASEKKVLRAMDVFSVQELVPTDILVYGVKTHHVKTIKRSFFTKQELLSDEKEMISCIKNLLIDAVRKRLPSDVKVGLLFSGGVDSSLLAKICYDLGINVTCYTAAFENPLGKEPFDVTASKRVAQRYGFSHKIVSVSKDKIEDLAREVTVTIEEAHAVKVGVGMAVLACAKVAREDGCRILLSGLGAEELFAGYKRHKDAKDVNDECLSGLMWLYERDLYRDDVLTMRNLLELRLPFLDRSLVEYSLKIPSLLKIKDGVEKFILRKAALVIGLDEEDAFRPKKAAQYGSKLDIALKKVAQKQGLSRAAYLRQFLEEGNRKLGVLCSGGKDSWFAAYIMKKLNYDLSCLLVMKSKNEASYMFHTPAIDIVSYQSKASGIPLLSYETAGEKEKELDDLKELLVKAKEEYGIDGVCVGALFSQYQRERVEKVCFDLGLKVYAPLWHIDQESELRELLREGFVITMSAIAADGLDASYIGRIIDEDMVEKLVKLREKIGFNVAGEGGEYESLVLDCPLFSQKLKLEDYAVHKEDAYTAKIVIKKVGVSSTN